MLENPMTPELITEATKAIAPKAYDDAAHPGLVQVGQAMEGLAKFIFLPFKCLGYKADELEARYKQSLHRVEEKLAGKECISPSPAIAAPLLDHIKFIFEEPELLSLFETLLASSIDVETANKCRPSFVSNLRDMSSKDAKVLLSLSRIVEGGAGSIEYFSRLCWCDMEHELCALNATVREDDFFMLGNHDASLDLLVSLGIIKKEHSRIITLSAVPESEFGGVDCEVHHLYELKCLFTIYSELVKTNALRS